MRVPFSHIAASLFATMLLAGPSQALAEATPAEVAEGFSEAFDQCLEVLRNNSTAHLGSAADDPFPQFTDVFPTQWFVLGPQNAVAIGAVFFRGADRSPQTFFSCHVRPVAEQGPILRRVLLGWTERMATGFEGFPGVEVIAASEGNPLPIYTWCENGTQPFAVRMGARLPGHPVAVGISSNNGTSPNPCEGE